MRKTVFTAVLKSRYSFPTPLDIQTIMIEKSMSLGWTEGYSVQTVPRSGMVLPGKLI